MCQLVAMTRGFQFCLLALVMSIKTPRSRSARRCVELDTTAPGDPANFAIG